MARVVPLMVALLLVALAATTMAYKDCNFFCPQHILPVCGSNGQTYNNNCELLGAQCEDSSITKLHDGECCQGSVCKPPCNTICNLDYVPVCGSDGRTYPNQCVLDVAICKDPSLNKAHDGKC